MRRYGSLININPYEVQQRPLMPGPYFGHCFSYFYKSKPLGGERDICDNTRLYFQI